VVLATNALTGEGIPDLAAAIDDHRCWLDERGLLFAKRLTGARAEVLAGLRASLDRRLAVAPASLPRLQEMIERVACRELTPRKAVAALAEPLAAVEATPRRAVGDQRGG
jgi:putative protein kinase ArgK-like GTPase of G3E family